ncbi:MAG: GIY-YIG nuclease family protein [Ruminococcaceae bacterium]|nr:GIY-YIG nuclease family protein [Oscillospiraceae bacterium]
MAFNKTIQMCIFDGNPNGRIMCELSNWNGRVYKISRNDLSEFANRPDCEYTGVYFLFGKNEDNKDTVYVGEAEKMLVRLKQHLKDPNYWNDCVVVISKDNILNKAHVKYLENKFYTLAVDAKRSSIINNTVPTCSSISEFDESMLTEFIENARLLVNTLGYKVFDKIDTSVVEKENSDIIFHIAAARGADAKGLLVPDGFMVIKGSKIAKDTVPSMSSNLVNLRNIMLEKNIINQEFVFVTDYIFTSPSLAAAIVMGRNANGRTEWKNINNKSIKDIEEE